MQTFALQIENDIVADKIKWMLEHFQGEVSLIPINSETRSPLGEEIARRIEEYRRGNMQTSPLREGLDEIREKYAAR